MKRLAAILLLALALAGCGGAATVAAPPDCTGPADAYSAVVVGIVERWDAAVTAADQAPAGTMAGRVADLRTIRREAAAVVPAPCMSSAHGHLLGSMDATLAAFDAYQAGRPQSEIGAQLDQAEQDLAEFYAALRVAIGE